MTKVCTHAGERRRLKRLLRPFIRPLKLERGGEGERSGLEDGDRGGEGSRDPDLDLRLPVLRPPIPISRAYGEMEDLRRLSLRARCSFSSSSISTSCISAATPSSGLMANPSFNILPPNIKNNPDARKCVNLSGMSVGTAWPRTAERTVMTISAANAAEKTKSLSCFMAMRAAIRNVLSPISENSIMVSERI